MDTDAAQNWEAEVAGGGRGYQVVFGPPSGTAGQRA